MAWVKEYVTHNLYGGLHYHHQMFGGLHYRHQKYEYANGDQFAPNSDMTYYNHITCLCNAFEVIRTNENRFMGLRSWISFYYVIQKKS